MIPSNKAIRNVWMLLMVVGIADFGVGIWEIITNPYEEKSWLFFISGLMVAVFFFKKFITYQRLVNRGIEYGIK